MSVAEIQAAIDALATPDQLQIQSDLAAKLFRKPKQAEEARDPFAELLDELEKEPRAGEPTNIAAHYKEYLYGRACEE